MGICPNGFIFSPPAGISFSSVFSQHHQKETNIPLESKCKFLKRCSSDLPKPRDFQVPPVPVVSSVFHLFCTVH